MLFSNLLCPTLKEDPADVEVVSHRLMLRSGMIRQVAAGIYSLLPTGLRTIRKVENIVREEMNRAGALEVYLPAVHPAELWKESGRWETIGKELLRFKDRNDRDFCFGPTHEEVITDLVRREIRSYRDLPKNLYQIQVKFRDEVRPRFGLMRCREFTMKDAYSFDMDEASADASYQKMYEAYSRIFTRCGLEFRAVEADSGNIGGSRSQEFMVLAKSGEDELISCTSCDYGANAEKATGKIEKKPTSKLAPKMEKKQTPGKGFVEDVAAFLKISSDRLIKTLIYKTESTLVAVLVPGDREVNEIKLKSVLNAQHLSLASAADCLRVTKSPVGYVGPVGLQKSSTDISRILTDHLIEEGIDYVVGANEKDAHFVGAVAGKDFELGERVDLHRTKAGDLCSRCGKVLRSDRGIEVGHIFKLGTKYSEAMGANFTDPSGKLRPAIMGCYGIGIGRTAAAAIEQNHDERGIVFPPALAPFDVVVVPVEWQKEPLKKESQRIYDELSKKGYQVLLDDRAETTGAKFKDADLIGIPVRVTVGEKGISQGKIEVKARWAKTNEFVSPGAVTEWVESTLQQGIRRET